MATVALSQMFHMFTAAFSLTVHMATTMLNPEAHRVNIVLCQMVHWLPRCFFPVVHMVTTVLNQMFH